RTHYPESVDEGIRITAQESWQERGAEHAIAVPQYIRQIVEQIAFTARVDKKVDKRSGVSQRLPISTLELVLSNAERRALTHGETVAVPRVADVYAALPGITGKIELEYEGEMRGADTVVREIIRLSVQHVFDEYFAETNTQQIEQWFNLGGTVKLGDDQPAGESLKELQQIQGLFDKLKPLQLEKKAGAEELVSAAEFLLEGMYAHKRLSRSEERGFAASVEKIKRDAKTAAEHNQQRREREMEEISPRDRTKRGFN
ncbi:MAG TPA: magnesium chelatase, partial [Acidobacteriaceae bacterium]